MVSQDTAEKIVESDGTYPATNLWGSFFVFWHNRRCGTFGAYRDPVSSPGLYLARSDDHCFLFTDLMAAIRRGLALPCPDKMAIAGQLLFPQLRTPATGLTGVAEILGGQRLLIKDGQVSITSLWRPQDVAPLPARSDGHLLAADLKDKCRSSVSAWSDAYGKIQLELSGGLDSSIVAACLKDRSAEWRAATLATLDAGGDERLYARVMASSVGIELAELETGNVPDPLSLLRAPRARPGGFGLLASIDRAFAKSAGEYGAEAIFTGAGGDNVFGLTSSIAPARDALRHRGPVAALSVLGDVAEINLATIWEGLGHFARMRRSPIWIEDQRFLSAHALVERPSHPWLADFGRLDAGRRDSIRALLRILPFVDAYPRFDELPMVAPLLSLPLVEFSLSVPTWHWVEGGRDRALARTAFAECLPEAILYRRTKGRLESLFVNAFNEARPRIPAMLGEGWLAGNGLIDMDAIAAACSVSANALDTAFSRILQIVDLELWVQSILGAQGPSG